MSILVYYNYYEIFNHLHWIVQPYHHKQIPKQEIICFHVTHYIHLFGGFTTVTLAVPEPFFASEPSVLAVIRHLEAYFTIIHPKTTKFEFENIVSQFTLNLLLENIRKGQFLR